MYQNSGEYKQQQVNPVPASTTMAANNARIQQTQSQVNEVVDIMRQNVEKVIERDNRLADLDTRADLLQQGMYLIFLS